MKNNTNISRQRYTILNQLGQGGSSITYAALDQETNQQVALKALSLTGLEDWKKIELFEREAKILQQLNYPAIPKYLDYFQIETESDVYFYIVQQLAPGQSLAHLISQGWQPDETTIKNIAEQILEILVYLQQLTPPVIHRDLKPQNIIYQPDTGKLFLVDFGAVQDTYHHTVMGSTVVGTYGYMAPEQYRGGAVLSTDLYSLGCTLLFLLTGESPAELPQKKLKIYFKNHVNIQRDFANWIDKLIEPNVKNRFPQAEAALLVLQEKKSLEDYPDNIIVKPKYSPIKITKDQEKLIIDIPPPYQRTHFDKLFYFWLPWTILSILNRFAIFLSAAIFGKIIIAIWFYIVAFMYVKRYSLITQYLFLILSLFFFKSIPQFALWLVFIDTILELFSNHNWLRPLFFTTRITLFNKSQDFNRHRDLVTVRKMIVEKKIFNILHKEAIEYLSPKASLTNSFLTSQEKKWLHSEIWGNDKLYETKKKHELS